MARTLPAPGGLVGQPETTKTEGEKKERRTFMSENSIRCAWEKTNRTGQVGMADARGVDLDQHLVRLHVVEVDLAELELAVELGHNEGGSSARHVGGCGWVSLRSPDVTATQA